MKKTNGRWLVVILLFFATAINYMDRSILGIAGPALKEDFSLSDIQFGLLGSAFFWTYALMQIPSGMIVDKLGARLTYTVAIVWWSLCTIMMVFGRGLGSLVGLRALMGIGEAPAFPTNTRVISDWLPAREKGTANGIFNSGVAVGVGLSTPLLAWIIASWGWRASFVAVGSLGFIWLIFWLIFFKNKPEQSKISSPQEIEYIREGQPETEPEMKINPFKFLKFRNAWAMVLGVFANNYLTYLMMTWLPIYLVTEKGVTLLSAGFYTMLPWILTFLANLLGGYLSDSLIRRGWNSIKARKTILAIGMLFPILLIPAVFVESVALTIAFLSIAVGGVGLAAGILWATASDIAPKGAEGKLAGLLNFLGNIAGWLAPTITGVLITVSGNFTIALIVPVVICLLASLGYIFIIKNERISLNTNIEKDINASI